MQTPDRPNPPVARGVVRFVAVLALSTFVVLCALPAEARQGADAREVAKLIDQLGHDERDVRKAAEKKLVELGEPVVESLRKASRTHPDADVRLRAILLIRAIQTRTFTGHTNAIRHIAVSKNGNWALTGSMDNTVRLWDLNTGKEVRKMTGHAGWAWQVAFSPDEKHAVSSGSLDKTLRLWDLSDGKEVRQYTGHTARAYGAAFSPDGKYVLSGGAGSDTDCTLRLFETESAKEVRRFTGHRGWIWKVHFSPDGKKAASAGCNDYSFRIWDVQSGDCLVHGEKAHSGFLVGIAFSPDGKHLLTSGRDLTVKLWDVETGKLVRTYTGMRDNVEAVAFSKDGKRFLAGEFKVVHVFETDSGKIIHRFEDHSDWVYAVAFTPDGRRAVSGGGAVAGATPAEAAAADNTLRVWGVPR